MSLRLYGLLHIAQHEVTSINVQVNSFKEQARLYIKNAVTLARSLERVNILFTILTNDRQFIISELKQMGLAGCLAIETCDFNTDVPSGINFYSAHFKLDVFRYFASLTHTEYTGLLDLDMIALGSIPDCLINAIQAKISLAYDISDQVIPAYSHATILSDMSKLSPNIHEGRWSGGEFILGTPDFFSALYLKAREIYAIYTQYFDKLHHQGDEMIVSVALEDLRREGYQISDAGTLGIVGRYWSLPVAHPQKPVRYYHENCFLLHLPADKKFLAHLVQNPLKSRRDFCQRHQRHLRKLAIRRFFSSQTPILKAFQ
jgi:hypothetical protein